MSADNYDLTLQVELLKRGHDELKDAVVSIKESQKDISKSLSRLVALEERHIETRESLKRAFTTLEKHDARIDDIERDMPQLKEMRSMCVKIIIAVIGAVGLAMLNMVIK